MKAKTIFFCQHCGAQSPKWIGKCPSCNEWNTYVEELVQKNEPGMAQALFQTSFNKKSSEAVLIHEIGEQSENRVIIQDKELSRVLGGGIVPGSMVLFGGEPGIGKSTLMLQVALQEKNLKVLYISGEESEQQIKMRATRIGLQNKQCYIYTETSTHSIIAKADQIKPDIIVVDSIQTLYSPVLESSAGSVSQIRQCSAELMKLAKESAVPIFLIGHITKDGSLAGPKVLEHIVDTVLQFEGERNHVYRLLRTTKNRFGSTNELGIYEMQGNGLREVNNPSEILITAREDNVSGVTIAATLEGLRPMLIETQALVSTAAYGTPQRSATGYDLRRLNMLLAVLEKRCGFRLGIKDVFLNIAGGLKVEDPAIDLALVCAILSSNEDIAIDHKICFAGEVGLSGEIRPVTRIEQRIAEAERLGFEQIYISKFSKFKAPSDISKIEIIQVSKIQDTFSLLFG
ncbi:MAG: DNA repair protein RadA [Bacteroidia bacterium]|nr:DNA repair protein RadA [Bacteroidia bacterium]MCZ2249045.1 DNA repair protein RadA [Bacteroidia bacterium]